MTTRTTSKWITMVAMLWILVTLLQQIMTEMKTQAIVLNSPKGSLRLLKHSSSSFVKRHRHKRDTFEASAPYDTDDLYYDENYEIIPTMSGDMPKTVGQHLSETAQQIAQSFSNMWQSLADTVKHCVEAIRQLFGSDGENNGQLTPEQEEEMRAAMEARGIAIEEQNEIWRNTYENQI